MSSPAASLPPSLLQPTSAVASRPTAPATAPPYLIVFIAILMMPPRPVPGATLGIRTGCGLRSQPAGFPRDSPLGAGRARPHADLHVARHRLDGNGGAGVRGRGGIRPVRRGGATGRRSHLGPGAAGPGGGSGVRGRRCGGVRVAAGEPLLVVAGGCGRFLVHRHVGRRRGRGRGDGRLRHGLVALLLPRPPAARLPDRSAARAWRRHPARGGGERPDRPERRPAAPLRATRRHRVRLRLEPLHRLRRPPLVRPRGVGVPVGDLRPLRAGHRRRGAALGAEQRDRSTDAHARAGDGHRRRRADRLLPGAPAGARLGGGPLAGPVRPGRGDAGARGVLVRRRVASDRPRASRGRVRGGRAGRRPRAAHRRVAPRSRGPQPRAGPGDVGQRPRGTARPSRDGDRGRPRSARGPGPRRGPPGGPRTDLRRHRRDPADDRQRTAAPRAPGTASTTWPPLACASSRPPTRSAAASSATCTTAHSSG